MEPSQTPERGPSPHTVIPDYRHAASPTRLSKLAVIAFVLAVATTPLALRLVPYGIVREAIKLTRGGFSVFMVPILASLAVTVVASRRIRRHPNLRGKEFVALAFITNVLSILFFVALHIIFYKGFVH